MLGNFYTRDKRYTIFARSKQYALISLFGYLPCGTKSLRVLIFAIFSTIREKKFLRKKFPQKFSVGTLFTVKISKEKDRLKVPHLLTD